MRITSLAEQEILRELLATPPTQAAVKQAVAVATGRPVGDAGNYHTDLMVGEFVEGRGSLAPHWHVRALNMIAGRGDRQTIVGYEARVFVTWQVEIISTELHDGR